MSIEQWIIVGVGFAFAFYSAITVFLVVGLGRIPPHTNAEIPFVSVIVAARNEEENMPHLLNALLGQSYRSYEIIIVDDGSADRTHSIAEKYTAEHQKLRVISADRSVSQQARKKAALITGILASKGEILCFTDADCIPGQDWVSEMIKGFTQNVGLVAGYSPYDRTLLPVDTQQSGFLASLLHDFVRYEEMKGAIWSAGSIGLEKGWLCTGRNLAYRRKVWNEVDGFSRIMKSISGDDDLFLQQVRRTTEWSISYARDPKSFVPTTPPASLRGFLEQRKRHFSAGKYFTLPMKLFFLLFHGSNLFLLLGLLAGPVFPATMILAIAFFVGKVVIDLVLVMKGGAMFSEDHAWTQVVHMELLCLLYNTLVGPLGFITGFEWKSDLKS